MQGNFWNDYTNWGLVIWFGFVFLLFSSFGNWGYTYRAHRKLDRSPRKEVVDILDERYARGEIERAEYIQLKADILGSGISRIAVAGS